MRHVIGQRVRELQRAQRGRTRSSDRQRHGHLRALARLWKRLSEQLLSHLLQQLQALRLIALFLSAQRSIPFGRLAQNAVVNIGAVPCVSKYLDDAKPLEESNMQ